MSRSRCEGQKASGEHKWKGVHSENMKSEHLILLLLILKGKRRLQRDKGSKSGLLNRLSKAGVCIVTGDSTKITKIGKPAAAGSQRSWSEQRGRGARICEYDWLLRRFVNRRGRSCDQRYRSCDRSAQK